LQRSHIAINGAQNELLLEFFLLSSSELDDEACDDAAHQADSHTRTSTPLSTIPENSHTKHSSEVILGDRGERLA
jgi:hypothetical protein